MYMALMEKAQLKTNVDFWFMTYFWINIQHILRNVWTSQNMLEIHSKISLLIQKLTFHLGLKIYLLPIYANWYIRSAKCVQLNKYKLNTITKFQASHKNIKFVSQISILKSCILYLPNTKGNFFRDPESIHEFKLFPSKKPSLWSAKLS